jgi:hypothetical protein
MTTAGQAPGEYLQQLKMNGDQQLAQCIWAALLQER